MRDRSGVVGVCGRAFAIGTIAEMTAESNGPLMDALKEWAVVCEALGRGHQAIICRAGGIEDDSFEVEASRFLLLPTRFHEDDSRLRDDVWASLKGLLRPKDPRFEISHIARIHAVYDVRSETAVDRLVECQALSRRELMTRFASRGGLLRVVVVRVLALTRPVVGGFSSTCENSGATSIAGKMI